MQWYVSANHAGGYSYRLCKTPERGIKDLTEECFQVMMVMVVRMMMMMMAEMILEMMMFIVVMMVIIKSFWDDDLSPGNTS